MRFTRLTITIFTCLAVLSVLSSCNSKLLLKVKKFPKDKPFVYSNQINVVNNKLSKDSLTLLKGGLETQLDDSMRVIVR